MKNYFKKNKNERRIDSKEKKHEENKIMLV